MATIHLWHVALIVSCVMMAVTSNGILAPDHEEAKSTEKRSGHYCIVNGYRFTHNEVFSIPGYSHCIKYRCYNGGWSAVQHACERNSQCVPAGSVIRDRCRSLRCKHEKRGNMNYYFMEPTVQDKCEMNGQCVVKNVDIQGQDCITYRCVPTQHGGYTFHRVGARCRDYYGSCVSVGARYSKFVNGHMYRNCICLEGGGYSCRG